MNKKNNENQKNQELDTDSLSSISGGYVLHPISENQAKDYQNHGSTVLYFNGPGLYTIKGQVHYVDQEGFRLLSQDYDQ